VQTKACKECHRDLPLTEFHKRTDSHGGSLFLACKDCENAKSRAKYGRRREHQRERSRLKWQRLKLLVLNHYGCRCACCGETEPAFLALDHIDGGGNAHRKEVRAGSGNFYNWVKKQGFPASLQVLCHNCNWAKAHGGCPHQQVRLLDWLEKTA
jgi:hypothetical protein